MTGERKEAPRGYDESRGCVSDAPGGLVTAGAPAAFGRRLPLPFDPERSGDHVARR